MNTLDPMSRSLDIIQQLDDEPNDVGGLTPQQLKAKFDEGPQALKEYINGTLVPFINTVAQALTDFVEVDPNALRADNIAATDEVVTALELDQAYPTVVDALLKLNRDDGAQADTLRREIDLRARCASGSYLGTGTFGADNPNTLEFDFEPRFVAIIEQDNKPTEDGGLLCQFLRGWGYSTRYAKGNTGNKYINNYVTWSGTTVSWYAQADLDTTTAPSYAGPSDQMNASGVTYCYFAIG